MDERTENTLLLDVLHQLQTLQGSVNVLLAGAGRAEEDRKEIKTQVLTINGRIRVLESARDHAAGAMWAVRTLWIVLAGLIGFMASWAAKKLGLS